MKGTRLAVRFGSVRAAALGAALLLAAGLTAVGTAGAAVADDSTGQVTTGVMPPTDTTTVEPVTDSSIASTSGGTSSGAASTEPVPDTNPTTTSGATSTDPGTESGTAPTSNPPDCCSLVTTGDPTTTTFLSISPERGGARDDYTFTAKVTASSVTAKPSGWVEFYDAQQPEGPGGWEPVAQAQVDPDTGIAVYTGPAGGWIIPPHGGEYLHVIRAQYYGDSTFASSTSEPLTYAVDFGTGEFYLMPFIATNPAIAGQPITVEVWVANGEDVKLCEGSTVVGSGGPDRENPQGPVVDLKIPISLPAGTHHIAASLRDCPADLNVSTVATLVVLRGSDTSSASPRSPGAHGNKPAANSPETTGAATAARTAVASTFAPTSPQALDATSVDPTTTGPVLAQTGSSVGAELGVGSGALVLGALLVALGRRRNRSAH